MSFGWVALSYEQWRATCDTLHAHSQVLGKLAAKLAPPEPEWTPTTSTPVPGPRFDAMLGEYILDWDDVRSSPDPHAAALEFARSVFRHACAVCGWDERLAASADGIPPPVS